MLLAFCNTVGIINLSAMFGNRVENCFPNLHKLVTGTILFWDVAVSTVQIHLNIMFANYITQFGVIYWGSLGE